MESKQTSIESGFEPIRQGTQCPFAKKANVFFPEEHLDLSTASLEEEIAKKVIPGLVAFHTKELEHYGKEPPEKRMRRTAYFDGFAICIAHKPMWDSEDNTFETLRRVLKALSQNDPKKGEDLDITALMKAPGWGFTFMGSKWYITTFSPIYPSTHSRFAFGSESMYILLQTRDSFTARGVKPADNPKSIRHRVRNLFAQAGRPYSQVSSFAPLKPKLPESVIQQAHVAAKQDGFLNLLTVYNRIHTIKNKNNEDCTFAGKMQQTVNILDCKDTKVNLTKKVTRTLVDKCTNCTISLVGTIAAVELVHCKDCILNNSGSADTIQVDMSDNVTISISKQVATAVAIVVAKSTGVKVVISDTDEEFTLEAPEIVLSVAGGTPDPDEFNDIDLKNKEAIMKDLFAQTVYHYEDGKYSCSRIKRKSDKSFALINKKDLKDVHFIHPNKK